MLLVFLGGGGGLGFFLVGWLVFFILFFGKRKLQFAGARRDFYKVTDHWDFTCLVVSHAGVILDRFFYSSSWNHDDVQQQPTSLKQLAFLYSKTRSEKI